MFLVSSNRSKPLELAIQMLPELSSKIDVIVLLRLLDHSHQVTNVGDFASNLPLSSKGV